MNTPDETVDVLVAGSAGALAGAYTAAREGLSVAIVEASDAVRRNIRLLRRGRSVVSRATPCSSARGATTPSTRPCKYYRSVVGDRTPAELQETYVRGGAALIDYLEQDEHFAFKILPWPDYYSSVAGARNDGMRHTVSKAVPDERLGRFQGLVRGPLDHERLGAPQPDLLTGGRAVIGRFLWAMADNPAVAAYLNTSLVELTVDDGRVTGGVVECEGRRRTIRARHGVLLAAGGFEQNAEMRAEYGVPGTAPAPWARLPTSAWRTKPRSPSARAPT